MSEIVCYDGDTGEFIKAFLTLDKKGIWQQTAYDKEVTIGYQYNAHHIRLLVATPSDVKSQYQIEFINDQVFITFRKSSIRKNSVAA